MFKWVSITRTRFGLSFAICPVLTNPIDLNLIKPRFNKLNFSGLGSQVENIRTFGFR